MKGKKTLLGFLVTLALLAGTLAVGQQTCEAREYRQIYRQHTPQRVYRHYYRPVVPRYYCAPPGNVYRHYHFKSRWYYYGPYCGPRILPPVIAVPLPVVDPGYYVDVQCTVCQRWWRWRPEYPGQRPEGLPPCWDYSNHEYKG
jgi:hypothetical protein